jgi:Icc protein
MIVLAQLSDIHFGGPERNERATARAMAYLDSLPGLDAILVTGDLTDDGAPDDYARVRKALASRYPVFTLPGNHDERRAYREVLLGEPAADGPVNRAHRVGGVLVAMCDSTIPGEVDGYLDDETIDWLDGVLTEAGRHTPAVVAVHHPPVVLHSPFLDGIRQREPGRLAGLLERHPQVAGVLCGHAHTAAATTFAGRPLRVAPGIASTLRLPWEGADTLSVGDPPAVAFHVLDDDGGLVTHFRIVP